MNRIASIFPALLFAFLLSSCGGQDESGVVGAGAEEARDADLLESAAGTATSADFNGSVQGGSFVLPFVAVQRYDRQTLTENTKRRQRQVLLETVGVPADTVLPAIRDQLESVGYKGGKVVAYRGGDRQYFRKKGHDEIAVLVRARGSGGPELKDPAATASIYMTETAANAETDEEGLEE